MERVLIGDRWRRTWSSIRLLKRWFRSGASIWSLPWTQSPTRCVAAIVEGKIQPGTRLGHEAVANSLGVSRQPVREALRQLQAEGFVLRSGNRAYVVREFTAEEVEQAYYLRWLLESDAAYFAAMGDHSEQVQRLKLINYGLKNALDLHQVDETARLNGEFHRLVRECSEMSLLVQVIDKIWVGVTILTPIFVPERARNLCESTK